MSKKHDVLVMNVTHADLMLIVREDTALSESAGAAAVKEVEGVAKIEDASPLTGTTTTTTTTSIAPKGGLLPNMLVARPKFSHYETLGRAALAQIDRSHPLCAPVVQDVGIITPRALGGATELTVGFKLTSEVRTDWSHLHLRGSAYHSDGPASIVACCLPLAAQIIPTWVAKVKRYAPSAKKTLLLVCGAGRPQNSRESMTSNSTRATAELIACFVKRFIPEVQSVHVVDSGYDVFSYEVVCSWRTKTLTRAYTIEGKC